MFTIEIGNRTLDVVFQRNSVPIEGVFKDEARLIPLLKPVATICEIHRLNEEKRSEAIVGRGYARCGAGDNFTHEKGRKIALARALKTCNLTKVERARVWDLYLNRPRPISVQKEKGEVKVNPHVEPAQAVQPAEEAIKVIQEGSPSQPPLNLSHVRKHAHLDLNAGEMG